MVSTLCWKASWATQLRNQVVYWNHGQDLVASTILTIQEGGLQIGMQQCLNMMTMPSHCVKEGFAYEPQKKS